MKEAPEPRTPPNDVNAVASRRRARRGTLRRPPAKAWSSPRWLERRRPRRSARTFRAGRTLARNLADFWAYAERRRGRGHGSLRLVRGGQPRRLGLAAGDRAGRRARSWSTASWARSPSRAFPVRAMFHPMVEVAARPRGRAQRRAAAAPRVDDPGDPRRPSAPTARTPCWSRAEGQRLADVRAAGGRLPSAMLAPDGQAPSRTGGSTTARGSRARTHRGSAVAGRRRVYVYPRSRLVRRRRAALRPGRPGRADPAARSCGRDSSPPGPLIGPGPARACSATRR